MARRHWVRGILIAALLVTGGVVWASGRGGGSAKATGEVVPAERGEVAVTVGGIGHVNTLAGAALLAVPAAGSSGGGAATSTVGSPPPRAAPRAPPPGPGAPPPPPAP